MSWRKRQLRMLVLHDMKLMLIYYGAAFVLDVKSQKRKELVVERYSDAHVFDGYPVTGGLRNGV